MVYSKNIMKLVSKTISSTLIILTIATTVGAGLTTPRLAKAQSSFSLQGLPSLLVNCTGQSGSIGKILAQLTGSKTSVTSSVTVKDTDANYREECAKALGRYIAKQMLDKITQDTINWINTGFQGEPAYIKNPESMFKSIADKEVYAFTSLIGQDSVRFPFGVSTAQSLVNSYARTFEQNAQFSLDQYVSTGSASDFYTDFRTGGWNAWNAMVMFPQNNPVGFGIMATNHLATKTYDPTYGNDILKVQQEVQQSGGFLNQKKCVATMLGGASTYVPDQTRSEGEWAALARTPITDANELDVLNAQSHYCTRWETVTPGSAISSQLTGALGTPLKSIEMADDLNKALAAVFDALLNQLVQKGLSGLTKLTDTNYALPNNFGAGVGSNISFDEASQNDDSWSTYGEGIDLYKLLISGQDGVPGNTDTLIDLQQAWLDKMNYEVQPRLLDVIRGLKKLDYWVPGPRADWMDYASQRLDEAVNRATDPNSDTLGAVISGIFGGAEFQAIGRAEIARGIIFIFNSYYASITRAYDPKFILPTSTLYNYREDFSELLSMTVPEIRKLPGFEEERTSNQEEIEEVTSIRNRLEYIKGKVEPMYVALANTTDPNEITVLNAEIDKQIKIFKQLAPGLKGPDSIEEISTLPEFYSDLSSYLTGLKYDVMAWTATWPVGRRPYNDGSGDLWPGDPELMCWDISRGPKPQDILSPTNPYGYPAMTTPAAFNSNPAGAMLSGYTPQSFVDAITQHYTEYYAPSTIPPTIQAQIPTVSAINAALNKNGQGWHELGTHGCSLLVNGYTEKDNEFSLLPVFDYRSDMDNGRIDLGAGFGNDAQDVEPEGTFLFGIKGNGGYSDNLQGYSYFEDKSGIY